MFLLLFYEDIISIRVSKALEFIMKLLRVNQWPNSIDDSMTNSKN